MTRITVIGGTGYAGAAIVAEAARRGHEVTALSSRPPVEPVEGVAYVQGDAADPAVLAPAIEGAEAVVSALAPRGDFTPRFREVNYTIAELADAAGARLIVVGGFSSLRPAPGEPRFVEDLTHVPEFVHAEVLAGAALIREDLPATPDSLDWVFVSPPLGFGKQWPVQPVGGYRLGTEIAVEPSGGEISAEDYALGVVDLLEQGGHRRGHVNLVGGRDEQ